MSEVCKNSLLILWHCFKSFVLMFVPFRFLMKKDVSKDIVLVTGAGSGIGRLIALKFAALGSIMVCWDVDKVGNEETARQIQQSGGKAFAYICDVSNRETVYATAEKVKSDVGNVTILVNNAGVVIGKSFLDLPDEKIEKVFGINALAHFWTCKAFLPDMVQANHGHIVTIASVAGFISLDKLSDYCASKHAAVALDEALKIEMRAGGYDGIRTTLVCPYVVSTGLFDGFKPVLLPALTPDFVAQQAVNGVLINEDVVILPKIIRFLIPLKFMFPVQATFAMYDMFGGTDMMKDFRGKCPAINGSKKGE